MQALVIGAIGQVDIRQIAAPVVGPSDVLVTVRHVGLCGSDLNTYAGLNPLVTLPRIPGHEIGGIIAQRGAQVPGAFAPGARVIVNPYKACGTCAACRAGRPNACKDNETLGVQRDGGICAQISLPHERLIVNETLPERHLALVEPLSVGFHAVARGRISKGDTVLVIGAGMIGVGAILGAAARGARVIVAEVSEIKREVLMALGADAVINPQTADLAAELAALTGGQGADVVIEAVGLPQTFRAAIDLVCCAGRVVYVGYAKAEVSYNTALFNLKELDILGSRNATGADFAAVIGFLEQNGALAERLISRVFPWAEAGGAFAYWQAHRAETFKVMVEMEAAAP